MIRSRDEGAVHRIILDRPDRRNALTREGLDALRETVTAVDPTETPVIYLEGAGSAFCAGADLTIIRDLDPESAREFARRGQQTMNVIESTDAVVVAGVDGAARGGGVELALAADLRIATPAASFAESGVALGLFGAWGGTRRLPIVVGESHARDISLTGRTVDADDALSMGLVSRVVDDPYTVAEQVAANDHRAVIELEGLLRDRTERTHDEQERAERSAFARLAADGLD